MRERRETGVAKGDVKKVVLAYSGGLDTSIILKWLQITYGCEVVTFTADLGQGEELAPAAVRPLAYAAATLFGLATSVLRMAFGGHFFTDIAAAGLVTFGVIWLAHGLIYRWPRTRLSDAGVDAALTRAFWPAYRQAARWRGREVGPSPSRAPLASGCGLPIEPRAISSKY